ncbi:uncharacterized protein LOC128387781 [Panonychus citri]|uniref:uncharacterized protein LOC128387781 n=1 Tax=Panonychus citri TaxID=50023 RepID=UPI002307CB52|nr:uncharacterized protein LOC128387781 [Panonychus citri]
MNLQLHYKLPIQPLLTTASTTTAQTNNSPSAMIEEIYSHELESYFPTRTEEKSEQLKKSCSFSNFQSLLSQEETNKNKFLVDLTQKKLKIFAFLSESSSSAFRNKILLQNTLKKHNKDDENGGTLTEPIKITDEDYNSFMSTESYNVPTVNVKFTARKRELREINESTCTESGEEWRTDFKKLKVSCPSEEDEMKVTSSDKDDDFLPDDLASVLLALRTLE